MMKSYKERQKSHKEWKLKSKVKNVKVGDVIDVRDTEYIWCKGEVIKIIKGKQTRNSFFSKSKS